MHNKGRITTPSAGYRWVPHSYLLFRHKFLLLNSITVVIPRRPEQRALFLPDLLIKSTHSADVQVLSTAAVSVC
jgi:hypothetical protein